jgi:hypothetical protein
MVPFQRIQVPSFGQPGRTDRHPEDARGLIVIASGTDVRIGQLGQHDGIAPPCLPSALGMDGFGLDEAMPCPRLAHSFRGRVRAHDTLAALRVEAMEGMRERVAAEVGAKALHVTRARQSPESGCDRLETTSRRGHRYVRLRSVPSARPQVPKLFTPGRLARARARRGPKTVRRSQDSYDHVGAAASRGRARTGAKFPQVPKFSRQAASRARA